MSFYKTILLLSACLISAHSVCTENTSKPLDSNESFGYEYLTTNYHTKMISFGGEQHAICFLNEYMTEINQTEIFNDIFMKLIINKAPHIFITHELLNSLLIFRRNILMSLAHAQITNPHSECFVEKKQLYYNDGTKVPIENIDASLSELFAFNPQEWVFYDTNIGLIYMRHHLVPSHVGINEAQFDHIQDITHHALSSSSDAWTKKIDLLFKPAEWNAYIKAHNIKTFIFFSGHGSENKGDAQEKKEVCGMLPENFAHVLSYFNNNLSFDTLGVISCFWPAKRILDLAQTTYNIATLNYNIITPISEETKVWTYIRPNLKHFNTLKRTTYEYSYPLFFHALQEIVKTDKHPNNELKEFLQWIDPVVPTRKNEGKNQRPTVIYAGQSDVTYLD